LLSHSQIVLLANGRVLASTVQNGESQQDFAKLFSECQAHSGQPGTLPPLTKVLLNDEHYYCSAGKFTSLSGDSKFGYLLLSSYEKSLAGLHRTQETLVLDSALATLLGTAIVWLLVRKVTQPLRALSASAQAVGQGDFSQRVQVTSSDECGELAAVFNQMTENLKRSRAQLESKLETLKTTQAQLI